MMLANYVAVWKLRGANRLVAKQTTVVLASSSEPEITASVTADPEPHLCHIDRAGALATLLLQGLFAPEKDNTPEERLAAGIEAVQARRAKQTGKGVFLVFAGKEHVPSREPVSQRDTKEFAVCFDAVDKEAVRSKFRPFVDATLTACGLSLAPQADRQVEKIGEIVYLDDAENRKPIYSFTVSSGGARVSQSTPMTEDEISAAGPRVSALMADEAMARPVSLLQLSFDQRTDALQAFIAAWSALEIFVNANFKAIYEGRWFSVMESGAPGAATPVFERFRDVMRDKYRLADKFLIIAAVLDPEDATVDDQEFRRLKKSRDDLLHAFKTPTQLPTDAVQKLLLKYMKSHLDRRN